MLFLLFEVAEFMCVNIVRQKLANLRIILYKECNKCDVTEQSASWDTCGGIRKIAVCLKAQWRLLGDVINSL